MKVTILGIERLESLERSDPYRVSLRKDDGEECDVDAYVGRHPLQPIDCGDIEMTIGRGLSILVSKKLRRFIDGENVKFPMIIDDVSE